MSDIQHQLKVENRLSTLESQMSGQNEVLAEILKEVKATNSRVIKLETHNEVQGAKHKIITTVVAFIVSVFTAIGMRLFS